MPSKTTSTPPSWASRSVDPRPHPAETPSLSPDARPESLGHGRLTNRRPSVVRPPDARAVALSVEDVQSPHESGGECPSRLRHTNTFAARRRDRREPGHRRIGTRLARTSRHQGTEMHGPQHRGMRILRPCRDNPHRRTRSTGQPLRLHKKGGSYGSPQVSAKTPPVGYLNPRRQSGSGQRLRVEAERRMVKAPSTRTSRSGIPPARRCRRSPRTPPPPSGRSRRRAVPRLWLGQPR